MQGLFSIFLADFYKNVNKNPGLPEDPFRQAGERTLFLFKSPCVPPKQIRSTGQPV